MAAALGLSRDAIKVTQFIPGLSAVPRTVPPSWLSTFIVGLLLQGKAKEWDWGFRGSIALARAQGISPTRTDTGMPLLQTSVGIRATCNHVGMW